MEQQYADIEWKRIAAVFGSLHFHAYIFGATNLWSISSINPTAIYHQGYSASNWSYNHITSRSYTSQARRWSSLTYCLGPTSLKDPTYSWIQLSTWWNYRLQNYKQCKIRHPQWGYMSAETSAADFPRHPQQFWSYRDIISLRMTWSWRVTGLLSKVLWKETLDRLYTGH